MLHQRKCREMIILVTNRKISINRKLVVSKLILWVQMLQRASIRSLLVKSMSKLRAESPAGKILGTIKFCKNFFFRSQPKKVDIPAAVPQAQSKKGRGRTPIIIVPASNMSIITLANVQKLLEEFKYVPHEVRSSSKLELNKKFF